MIRMNIVAPRTSNVCRRPYDGDGYEIGVAIGQSNSVAASFGKFNQIETPEVDDRIFQYGRNDEDDGQIIPALELRTDLDDGQIILSDVLQHHVINTIRPKMGPHIPFMRRLLKECALPNRDGLILPAAYGGTSTFQWTGAESTSGVTGSLYLDMKTRLDAILALPGNHRISHFIFHIGETDINGTDIGTSGYSAAAYEANVRQIIEWIRDDYPDVTPIPILMGTFSDGWLATFDAAKLAIATDFENRLNNSIATIPGVAVANSAGVEDNFNGGWNADPNQVVHFSSAGQIVMANRYYAKFQELNQIAFAA